MLIWAPKTQVPAALLLAFLPSTYKMIAAGKHADTATPRRVLANVEKDSSIDKQVATPLIRGMFFFLQTTLISLSSFQRWSFVSSVPTPHQPMHLRL